MDLPDTLPGKLYLLAYNPERGRPIGRADLDLLLRAAALTDLLQRGLVRDVDGRPSATGRAPHGLNPVLADLLDRIAETKPHPWGWWIRLRGRPVRSVRDDLAAAGWIRVEEHRILGLFPTARITERDPRVRKALAATVSSALTAPASRIEPADAALVALADAAHLRTVLTRHQRRDHRERLTLLADQTAPIPHALRNAIRSRRAAASS